MLKFQLFSCQESADNLFSFPRGYELPALCPVTEKKEQKRSSDDEEEEKRMTDAELVKQDAVKVGHTALSKCASSRQFCSLQFVILLHSGHH